MSSSSCHSPVTSARPARWEKRPLARGCMLKLRVCGGLGVPPKVSRATAAGHDLGGHCCPRGWTWVHINRPTAPGAVSSRVVPPPPLRRPVCWSPLALPAAQVPPAAAGACPPHDPSQQPRRPQHSAPRDLRGLGEAGAVGVPERVREALRCVSRLDGAAGRSLTSRSEGCSFPSACHRGAPAPNPN